MIVSFQCHLRLILLHTSTQPTLSRKITLATGLFPPRSHTIVLHSLVMRYPMILATLPYDGSQSDHQLDGGMISPQQLWFTTAFPLIECKFRPLIRKISSDHWSLQSMVLQVFNSHLLSRRPIRIYQYHRLSSSILF
jgi:hypothetical protein